MKSMIASWRGSNFFMAGSVMLASLEVKRGPERGGESAHAAPPGGMPTLPYTPTVLVDF